MTSRVLQRDSGLTLVEILVVTVLLGLIAAVIAAAAGTILRISPETTFRVDDARSTRGLQTWLVRDVASTPPREISLSDPYGYLFAPDAPAAVGAVLCPGADPSNYLLHMAWFERSVDFASTYYRDGGRIVRSTCGGDTSTVRLTSGVSSVPCSAAPWSSTRFAVPVDITPPPVPPVIDVPVDSVEICLTNVEEDTGLNQGGGSTSQITLSISSRNRAT